jgi:signal transduction histidine kinase
VLHTLEASIWCLLTTENYKDAVLKAVNLGDDTDTTGAVTGGLAGLLYGFDNIPKNWLKQIARYDDIENLAERLGNKIDTFAKPETFELGDLIAENEALFNVIAGQKSITIHKVLPNELSVFADKPMIRSVLRNLISNAIKFTKQGGEIKFSAEKRSNEILISIRDNGIGIAPARLEKLFRIDENNSTPGTNNEKGTGLGLILRKEFVEKHGGKIWAESVQGKGTTFYFILFNKADSKQSDVEH